MIPGLPDHILAFVLVVVLPPFGAVTFRKLRAAVRAGHPGARLREYRVTTAVEWILVVATVGIWIAAKRPLEILGFALPAGLRTVAGAAITALVLGLLSLQWRQFRRADEAGLAPFRKAMRAAEDMLPRTDGESRGFAVLSVTAGICEEILYRGFLISYLATWVGVWPAVLLGALLFGIAHLYQGPAGATRATLVGLVLGALYAGTGSLLWPMILHAAMDLQAGAMARQILAPPVPRTA